MTKQSILCVCVCICVKWFEISNGNEGKRLFFQFIKCIKANVLIHFSDIYGMSGQFYWSYLTLTVIVMFNFVIDSSNFQVAIDLQSKFKGGVEGPQLKMLVQYANIKFSAFASEAS